MGNAGLEEDRVDPVLGVEEGGIAIDTGEEMDALVALLEVGVIHGEGLGAAGASERPARCHLQEEKTNESLF